MDFGYFTLSDNHYENNTRDANQFVADITDEALYADQARHALGLDRRASFQFARRALLPRSRARLYRGAHQAHPACARRHGAAAASSDPRRRAMGDARPALERARRFRGRPRLRRARIPAVQGRLRRQPGHLRGGHGAGAHAVGGGRPHLAPRQALSIRRRAHHAEAGAAAPARLRGVVLQALDRACGAARLRADRRAVRRRDELRRPEAGGRPLSRELRQVRHQAGQADVQLLRAFRRQQGRRRMRSARARSATTRNA